MIYRSLVVATIGKALVVWLSIVVPFPYPRQASDAKGAQPNNVSRTKVIDIGSSPASVVQLPQVTTGFMVTTDEDSQIWCHSRPAIVLVEVSNFAILDRTSHAVEIFGIADCLSIL